LSVSCECRWNEGGAYFVTQLFILLLKFVNRALHDLEFGLLLETALLGRLAVLEESIEQEG
jgi:hypothetical protein